MLAVESPELARHEVQGLIPRGLQELSVLPHQRHSEPAIPAQVGEAVEASSTAGVSVVWRCRLVRGHGQELVLLEVEDNATAAAAMGAHGLQMPVLERTGLPARDPLIQGSRGADVEAEPAGDALGIERGRFREVDGIGALGEGAGLIALLAAHTLVGIEGDELMLIRLDRSAEGDPRLEAGCGKGPELEGEPAQATIKDVHTAAGKTALRLPPRSLLGETKIDLVEIGDALAGLELRHPRPGLVTDGGEWFSIDGLEVALEDVEGLG